MLIIDGKGYTVDNMQTIPRELHSRHFSEKKNDTHLMIVWRDLQCIQSTVKHSSLKIKFSDHGFDCSEQAYQWAKADYCNGVAADQKLLYTRSPREAKDLGLAVI